MKLFFYFDLVFEADVVYVLGKRKLAVNEIHIKRTNYMTTKNVLGTSSKNKNLQWGQGQSLFASESVKPNTLCLFFFFFFHAIAKQIPKMMSFAIFFSGRKLLLDSIATKTLLPTPKNKHTVPYMPNILYLHFPWPY